MRASIYAYDGIGVMTLYEYDTLGRCVGKTNAEGTVITFTYDPSGNVTSASVDNGGEIITVSWTYDAEGKPLSYTDELGSTTCCKYNSDGSTDITDAAGTAQ